VVRSANVGVIVLAGLALAHPAGASALRRTPIVAAVDRVKPAVVNIATEQLVARRGEPGSPSDTVFDEFFRDFAEPRFEERLERASLGSGTIIDGRGYVLTNEHVVARASLIRVILADQREFEAEVAGTDPASDLAVLRVKGADRLPAVPLGTSNDLQIGETLIAIGNPFGLSHTVTAGVLSATGRTVRAGSRVYGDFLQTDASINPGNSGGPIVNLDGEVVGIATAVFSSGHGIGFAIPIDRARRVAESLIRTGTVHPAWIGVDIKPAGEALARSLHLGANQGLVVTGVVEASPAADGGLAAGDVIAAVSGEPVGTPAELEAALAGRAPGGPVKLEVVRQGGERAHVNVRPLGADSPRLGKLAEATLGMKLKEAGGESAGLVVTAVAAGGRAAARGLRPGDLVLEMDGVKLDRLATLSASFYKALTRRTTLLLVMRGDAAYYLPMALE
jgi:serine protease Do